MQQNAVIAGTFADFKLVKTRKVAQIVIEVPIERAGEAIAMFGIPGANGTEQWVAVAAMVEEPKADERPRRKFDTLSPSQQAGILCNDERFQKWCGKSDADGAATVIRNSFFIQSRAELNAEKHAADWLDFVHQYRVETGQEAEDFAA